jgi:hypothetical protein
MEIKNNKPIKESIKKRLVERHIDKKNSILKVQYKLEIISEDFQKQNYRKFFTNLSKLANAYNNSKIGLNESVDETFSKAFNMVFNGSESEAKEKAIDYFINKMQASGPVADNIRNELSLISDKDVSLLFTDPDMVAEKIADAVLQSGKQESSSDDGTLMSAVSVTFQEALPEKKGKLVNRIKNLITPTQSKLQGNVTGVADSLKSKFLELVK